MVKTGFKNPCLRDPKACALTTLSTVSVLKVKAPHILVPQSWLFNMKWVRPYSSFLTAYLIKASSLEERDGETFSSPSISLGQDDL